jgi:hypothetical protein
MDDDALLESWPAELREAWTSLRLPSLAEQLLAYERLAAEVRRQNQELRRLTTIVQTVPAPADDGGRLAAALEAAQALTEGLARSGSAALIEVCESAERHAQALAQTVAGLLGRPAASGLFGRAIAWDPAVRSALTAQVEGAALVAQKALSALGDAGLSRLEPHPGEVFDPASQRCVGTRPGPAGRIISRERAGWARGSTIIRPAEVLVGQDPLP